MAKFLSGLVIGVCLIPVAAFIFLSLGLAPVATSAPPFPMERQLARRALKARIAKEATAKPSIPVNESNLISGAMAYRQHCAVCHGYGSGQESAISKGMFPQPPQLLIGKGVTDDPPGDTYWLAANGIRLTGMPGFRGSLTEEQLWQVSLLLANADKLPANVKTMLATPAP
jgi:mono/diheme cytochrome c family protein